jgi:N-acyl-D-aspartate/D-glutamate deacylase
MTIAPARRVEKAAPRMARKGRLQVGADADITVFDPQKVLDRATFQQGDIPSAGIRQVLVGGTFVVRDGAFVEDARPGQAIRGESSGGPAATPRGGSTGRADRDRVAGAGTCGTGMKSAR